MKKISLIFVLVVFVIGLTMMSCGDNTPFEPPNTGGGGGTNIVVPPMFDEFWEDVTISRDVDDIIIETKSKPTYRTPYFGEGDPNYVPYSGTNPDFQSNGNIIQDQTITFRIPIVQDIAANKTDTEYNKPIGIAVNGVVLFNQFSGPNDESLDGEFDSFDKQNGHPNSEGLYHYHIEPPYVIENVDEDKLVGVMLDGYPIYGPIENGEFVNNSELDEYHGHFHDTFHQPDSIYHYHITKDFPYINGGKFYGVPGTVSN